MTAAMEVFYELSKNSEFYNGLKTEFEPGSDGESCQVTVSLPNGTPANKLQTYPLVAALVLSYFETHPLFPVIQQVVLSHADDWLDAKRSERAEMN